MGGGDLHTSQGQRSSPRPHQHLLNFGVLTPQANTLLTPDVHTTSVLPLSALPPKKAENNLQLFGRCG